MSGAAVAVEHRVVFDFDIRFSNGGGLQGQGFRLDIDGDDIDDAVLAEYIVRDLRLLMVGSVRIANKRIIVEAHKRSLVRAASDHACLCPKGPPGVIPPRSW